MNKTFYDQNGKVITGAEWAKLFQDTAKRIVAQQCLKNGIYVSTVWLGLNHNFSGRGRPLIYETMVFPKEGDGNEMDYQRYFSRRQAEIGHKKMIAKWEAKKK